MNSNEDEMAHDTGLSILKIMLLNSFNVQVLHHSLPKYQNIEIKKTSRTSKKSFDSIMMSDIVFLDTKNPI